MKKLALLSLALFTAVACKNNPKTENQSVTEQENPVKGSSEKPTLETGCYAYNSNGNTIKMEITEVSGEVSGDLNIAYSEKDANQGKFVGTLNGDKLIGTYTFNSERTESIREMAFLVKGNQLIEGYGELNENGTKFKDMNTIEYNSTMPLTKVECDK